MENLSYPSVQFQASSLTAYTVHVAMLHTSLSLVLDESAGMVLSMLVDMNGEGSRQRSSLSPVPADRFRFHVLSKAFDCESLQATSWCPYCSIALLLLIT